MLSFICFVSFYTNLWACGGSCLECHAKLQPLIDDKDHAVLKECVQCHTTTNANHGVCGQDCFDCHPKEKLYAHKEVQAHQSLKACITCHKEKSNFLSTQKSPLSTPKPMIETLK